MSTQLKQMVEEVHKLSRAEQVVLISSIAQMLSGEVTSSFLEKSLNSSNPTIAKGDKSIDPKALFGLWANSPRTIDEIRQKAWERN